MTSPMQHDLSRLTIRRDTPPPPVRTALRTSALIFGAVVVLGGVAYATLARRGIPVVQTAVVAVSGGGAASSATGVVANGYVVARTKASVSAKIPGRLAFLGVSEGSRVRAGDVIARLENADYQAAVTQAEANLAVERASLAEAQADSAEQRREAQRAHDLRTSNANLISQADVDAADSKAAQADARVAAARARIDAAGAALRLAQANYENTLIRAPFNGTVLAKDAEVGEVVAPSVGGGLTRGAVVTMADLGTLEVEVDVNEAYIGRIHGAQEARITLDAYPDTSFHGRVRQIVPTADRQRATVQVKVSILDHDARILPEMGARVDFLEAAPRAAAGPAASTPPIVRVSADAVRDEGGESVVYLVREGRLVRRAVVAGPVSGGMREIRGGLAGGEELLTGGVDQPKDGMRVKKAS